MSPIELSNESVSLEILPSVGGKISSLIDKKSDHEWLWTNPWLKLRNPHYGESYVSSLDFGGWDEIFPSIEPCRISTPEGEVVVPDHGDLVQLPWRVVASGMNCIEMEVEGRCLPFLFRRHIDLEGAKIRLNYSVQNLANYPFPWMWCTHLLMPLDPDTMLEAAADFHVFHGMGTAACLHDRAISWSELPPRSERWSAKLFSQFRSLNSVRISKRDGLSLRLDWNSFDIPYLGLWVNHGGWSGCGSDPYLNLGIEPTTQPADQLSAVKDPPQLQPRETIQWSLDVTLNS
ncbi:MAG: hypothetical protein ACO3RV_02625 [Luteolibacter sp.]